MVIPALVKYNFHDGNQKTLSYFQELKHPPTGKGMEDDTFSPISWPFYEDMDHITGHRPIMAPPCLVSSLEDYEDDHEDLHGKTSTDKHEEPPSKKNRTERMYDMIIEHCTLI